ncbi:hypothetical protein TcCL_Unassigned05468 [Trypanosoma cruzi]|nr:hypothetical protein TcCL_Unassigned05468 [Trypanosoma cruzi]
MHAHIKATESTILLLSLSTGSGTLLPRPHTHTHTRYLRLPSLGAHDTSTGTTTASAAPDTSPGIPAAVTHTERAPPHEAEAEANPHPSMTRHKNLQPSCPQWDLEPNST